jgi:L-rhamnose mutarotase
MSTSTVAFCMQLNPGREDEYRRRHEQIWPELQAALLAAGVLDYRIFLEPGSHRLFAVLTHRNDHRLESLRDSALMRRWWAMMADIMQTNADASPVETPLAPMFALSAPAG